jgi:AraC-type DNA-binding domain-containing proteins
MDKLPGFTENLCQTERRRLMEELYSCQQAMENCSSTQTFAIAHLYKEEKTMDMHIHDCYEIYYSISGGRQFLIDNKFYAMNPGDVFIINQYESHKITQVDKMVHERIVLSIHPEYTKRLSTPDTDLDACFSDRPQAFCHRISLSKDQQSRFLYYINKITGADGYGHDVVEQTAFMELMLLINNAVRTGHQQESATNTYGYNHQVDDILAYINQNIASPISIEQLAGEFFLSESYICRIFKSATGTTINKYINARRISIAKALLSDGANVTEAYEKSGFSDYSNFFKAFTKAVGISPKKYAQCSVS